MSEAGFFPDYSPPWPPIAVTYESSKMYRKTIPSHANVSNFAAARAAFLRGENVTQHLRSKLGIDHNTSDIIEIAYDLQAGTYVSETNLRRAFAEEYASEMASILNDHVRSQDKLLDLGCGEMTTLSLMAGKLTNDISALYAFDISWSRIKVGLKFAAENMKCSTFACLCPFTADISEIPLRAKSVDVTTTSHALEPNGGREAELLKEILRVTRRVAVLYEPSYELNSREGQTRMDELGYIKNLKGAAEQAGAKLREVVLLRNSSNPLNPTAAFIIEPGEVSEDIVQSDQIFSDPGLDSPLQKFDNFYFSAYSGLAYPIIQGIPILRSRSAILTSVLEHEVSY
jgi:ubiquinone/menaquinone biosynthesis C-methylase UbiE